jgi:TonB family protein
VNGETTGRAIGAAHPAVPLSVPMATIAPAPLPATPPRVQAAQTPPPAAPTPQSQTGISGRVFDGTGGAIPGATITVSSPAMGRSYQTVTNAAGRFTVPTLDAGAYSVSASLVGFKTARVDNVLVTPPGLTMIAIRLELGTLSETVMITAPGVGSAITQSSARPGSEYFDLAKAYYEQGRYVEAEQVMARALEMVRAATPPQPPVFEPPPAPPQPGDPNRPSVPIRIGGDIREPRKVKDAKPIYPADALAAQISGVVILEATVAKDGTVRDVRVLRSIPMLDAAAIDAVQQWQYTPTLLNGVAVEVLMTVTVNFAAR